MKRLALTAKIKPGGAVSRQAAQGPLRGQPVEGIVDLHRGEAGGVIGEKPVGAQVIRIKGPPPVAVVPARGADVDGGLGAHIQPFGP